MYKHNKTPINVSCRKILLVLMLSGITASHAANSPDPQAVIQQLGIGEQLESLKKGETVSFDIAENTEKELAAGVAMFVPVTPDQIIKFIKQDKLASIDTDITAHGTIANQAGVDAFKGFAFTAKQDKEAENFLAAEAGDDFNLSAQEIDAIKAMKTADAKATRETASQGYRTILLQRWEAYRKKGLQGIPTYQRKDTTADPAAELRNATVQSKVLESYFPDLYKVWLNYPAALQAGAEEQFFWLNRTVEKRPTAILGHRIVLDAGNSGAVILARQFYVGHSYNSNQLSIGCLPYQNGSLVFYANRTSTDQVAGMGSSLKHSIGREQMRGEIVKRLKKLLKLLKSH